jgi:hypothetical protein
MGKQLLPLVSCCFQALAPYLTGDILQFMLRLPYSFVLSVGVDVKSTWSLIKMGPIYLKLLSLTLSVICRAIILFNSQWYQLPVSSFIVVPC